jgi:predicted site-specific integrase-resolvase
MQQPDMNMDQSPDDLLDERDVAKVLKVSIRTVARWRRAGAVKIPFAPLGTRMIRYKRSDVQAFIDAGRQDASDGT